MKQTSNDGSPHLITIQETAKRLGSSVTNVYALVAKGELPVVPIGLRKGYRVDLRDLEQFIDQRKFRCVARTAKSTTYHPRHIRT